MISRFESFDWGWTIRHQGLLSAVEQSKLQQSTVLIAGCGGMGGLSAIMAARVGIGRLIVADPQTFDLSNMNRQYSARLDTIGRNKAEATAEDLFRIFGHRVRVVCVPEGINARDVVDLVADCDLVFDLIEYYAPGARIRLHQAARHLGKTVLNCNVVGQGTRCFCFTPESITIEEFLEMDENTPMDNPEVIIRFLTRFAPRLPAEFTPKMIEDLLVNKQQVPILGATPPLSTGFLLNQALLHLLGRMEGRVPPMPAYGYLNTVPPEGGIHLGKWW